MLDQLIYNPFEDVADDIPDELDPDQNFYQTYTNPNSKSCKYYYPDRINPKILKIPENSLAMLHLNIRSLPKNMRQLQNLLDTTDITFQTISITETWLKDHNVDTYSIKGYQHEYLLRQQKPGGGV